jgi:hypothetical protein
MTTTERQPLPPIACTPWCRYGDGHPGHYFASDQTCYGEQHLTPTGHNEHDHLAVMAPRHGIDATPNVCVNVCVRDVDVDGYLTVTQARLLAESLLASAKEVEGTG